MCCAGMPRIGLNNRSQGRAQGSMKGGKNREAQILAAKKQPPWGGGTWRQGEGKKTEE